MHYSSHAFIPLHGTSMKHLAGSKLTGLLLCLKTRAIPSQSPANLDRRSKEPFGASRQTSARL